jgi:hypothetical protein
VSSPQHDGFSQFWCDGAMEVIYRAEQVSYEEVVEEVRIEHA